MKFFINVIIFSACTLASSLVSADVVSGKGTWESTLHARDLNNDGTVDAYYDSSLNITWLADWNTPRTSGYDTEGYDGLMGWSRSMTWAQNLVIGSYSDWRLPTMHDTTCIYILGNAGECMSNYSTENEMAHLFQITLGNPINSGTPINTGPFSNVQMNGYWTDTRYTGPSLWTLDNAYLFITWSGDHGHSSVYGGNSAVAVMDGDPATPVPAPLPVLGAVAALGWSRKLRRRIKESRANAQQ